MRRRTFLNQTIKASAAISAIPLFPATFQQQPFRLAIIGCGWWGNNILREALRQGECKLVGICDVDQAAIVSTKEEMSSLVSYKPKVYTDYRDLISEQKPEIAIVATPDHWHALPAIEAIKNGAHVYLEKPIGHTINEGKAILKASRDFDRKVQIGTHRRVSPHNISGMKFLRSGKVGKVSAVKCFVNYGGGPGKLHPDRKAPAGLDWNSWCGPAPFRPFNDHIHPKGFRQFLDFANGTIADWGIHWFDQVLWWTEERYPTKIYSTGGKYVKKDNSDAPDTQYAVYDFEKFTMYWEHKLSAGNKQESANVGCYFYGTKGTFHMGWTDGWTFYPKAKGQEVIHYDAQLNKPDDQNIAELWQDFMSAIQDNREPVCDVQHGHLATNISLLGMISYKLGRSIRWDGKNEMVLDDPEANRLLARGYRKPWVYPD